ncbi:hypothetical protein BC828DRAFT_408162 [Blastocladiella britannica]|nr:hypothetical protein BC828DRAFT_408162 [Blastocladiella britannica]
MEQHLAAYAHALRTLVTPSSASVLSAADATRIFAVAADFDALLSTPLPDLAAPQGNNRPTDADLDRASVTYSMPLLLSLKTTPSHEKQRATQLVLRVAATARSLPDATWTVLMGHPLSSAVLDASLHRARSAAALGTAVHRIVLSGPNNDSDGDHDQQWWAYVTRPTTLARMSAARLLAMHPSDLAFMAALAPATLLQTCTTEGNSGHLEIVMLAAVVPEISPGRKETIGRVVVDDLLPHLSKRSGINHVLARQWFRCKVYGADRVWVWAACGGGSGSQ